MATCDDGAHVGGSLSIADILTVLYFAILRIDPAHPRASDRDILILSKGHAAPALYAALAERGFLSVDELASFGRPGSRLMAHPVRVVPGVEVATGSLGHGLSVALGFALAAREDDSETHPFGGRRTFCVLGDGELQEGSVWEAAMAAGSLRLRHLVAIVDRNQLQITGRTENTLRLEPLAARFEAFGWEVVEVDGHDVVALRDILGSPPTARTKPLAVIAKTVKGKGIDFIEGKVRSHFACLSPVHYASAMSALERTRPNGMADE